MPHAALTPVRHLILAELEAAIARAEGRLMWHRLVLGLRAMVGLDTRRAEAKLRRIGSRLDALRERRSLLLLAGWPRGRSYG